MAAKENLTENLTAQAGRERLRAERRLELVSERQEGAPIDLVKNGTYGFTYSPGTEGVPLYQKPLTQTFEIHKTADGALHVVGFLTESEAARLEQGRDFIEVKLYPEPRGEAQRLASVAMRRVMKAKPVSRSDGNYLPLQIMPERDARPR